MKPRIERSGDKIENWLSAGYMEPVEYVHLTIDGLLLEAKKLPKTEYIQVSKFLRAVQRGNI